MALARLYTRALAGMEAPMVTVEVHLSGGLPAMTIVGLAETAVKESRDRVRSALVNSFFEFPVGRITVNLAPADLPKGGGRYDLAIALGILIASGQLPEQVLTDTEVMGELSLSGGLQPVTGALPAALAAQAEGRRLILPLANAPELAILDNRENVAVDQLLGLVGFLRGQTDAPDWPRTDRPNPEKLPCLSDVHGQPEARRALEVAAAGGHNLLLFGPPGTGKSMLASRLPGILPAMSREECLEVAAIRSVCGLQVDWGRRPYRAPHHTCSGPALVGGGRDAKPGEVTLAHQGVLFLDELTEFQRHTLDVLREPLESGEVLVSRAMRQNRYPARFQLIAAMNPTPSGERAGKAHDRGYSREELQRYLGRISGPLLDRIDLYVEVPEVPLEVIHRRQPGESSEQVRLRAQAARDRQIARQGLPNAALPVPRLDQCRLSVEADDLLRSMATRFELSVRSYHRLLRVARTLADLCEREETGPDQVAGAFQLRQLDRLGL